MAALVIIACIAALLGLLWFAQNDLGWAGLAALGLLTLVKWVLVIGLSLLLILVIVYTINIH